MMRRYCHSPANSQENLRVASNHGLELELVDKHLLLPGGCC